MEKRYWLYLFVISLSVGLGILIGYFCVHAYFSNFETRLNYLEANYTNSLKNGQEIKLDEVKVLIDKSQAELRDKSNLLTYFGLPFTIAALLGSIFSAFKWAAEIAKEEAKKAFKDPDLSLKESKSLLVVTPDKQDESWIRSFFQLMDFNTPTFKKTSDLDSVKNEKFDLAILNVPNDEPRKESAHNGDIDKLTMAKAVFYFGPGQVSNKTLDMFGKLSYANAKSQLYGNLINALKFQKMLD